MISFQNPREIWFDVVENVLPCDLFMSEDPQEEDFFNDRQRPRNRVRQVATDL